MASEPEELSPYTGLLRPLLFVLPPETAHTVAFAALAPAERAAWIRAIVAAAVAPAPDPRLVVRVMGLEMPNPIGIAGGFDKNARRPQALAALGFGHLELGTVTARAQVPNPPPNLFRLPDDRALLNRLGFPNEGAERVVARLREARPHLRVPVGMSIGKSRAVPIDDLDAVVADHVASLSLACEVADFVVVNVSSPNTAGLRSMQRQEHARVLLGALAARAKGKAPLLVKVAPDLDDAQLEEVLAVVEEKGLTGVVATNTTVSRVGLATDARAVEAMGAGGLSGPPLRARALEVVRRTRARLGREPVVVGVGGVETAQHAMALVRAGANLVQMYTGFVYGGPGTPGRIVRELGRMLTRDGVGSLADLVGADARG